VIDLVHHTEPDMSCFACSEALDCMEAYYKVTHPLFHACCPISLKIDLPNLYAFINRWLWNALLTILLLQLLKTNSFPN
jgi:hypothetical protein